jgi:hypothetical protein
MFANLVTIYIDFIVLILKKLGLERSLSIFGVTFTFAGDDIYQGSINERIAKIDEAKANLLEGLRAIDELKEAAEYNKKQAEEALIQIVQLEKDKTSLQQELKSIKNIVQSDVNAFRKIAGVPSPAMIRKERIVGFISGVIASIVASGIVWAIVKLIQHFTQAT